MIHLYVDLHLIIRSDLSLTFKMFNARLLNIVIA